MMRSFTFSDGKSNKFWNITLQGTGFTVQFGKIGTAGQTQIKDFADAAAATKEHDKLVAEKLKKGYVETTAAAAKPAAAPTPAPAPAKAAPAKAAAPPPAPTPAPAPAAAASGKRTFEFSDATSHKFWNIELTGTGFTVNYGRIGSSGQTQLKSYPDATKAQKEYDKLIAEKTSKGYRETTPTAKPAVRSLRESLEEAIVENPDDLASHMAYADYLTDEGDPLGDFIRVQLALEDESRSTADRNKLKKQETKLLEQHQMAWLGELGPVFVTPTPHPRYEWRTLTAKLTWVRGWLHTVELANQGVEVMRVVARAPQMRLVRRLVLGEGSYEEPGEYPPGDDIPEGADYPQLYPLVRCPYLSNVKTFILGEEALLDDSPVDGGGYSCHTNAEGVLGVIKLMPKLEELHLLAHGVDADQLYGLKTLHHLRIFVHFHDRSYPLTKLAKNPSLGKLTHLACHPHAMDDDDPYIRLPELRAIVRSGELKALTHLRLRLTDFGDKGAQEIVNSGILKRLKVLDLQHGCMTDAGAQTLAACKDLTNLEHLVLCNNCMTEAGVQALQATGVKVETGYQWRPTGNEYEDREYLYAGDIE